jgi:hypothetical protein
MNRRSRIRSAVTLLVVAPIFLPGCREAPGEGLSVGATLPDRTPLAEADYTRLTSHQEMMAFLEAVAAGSDRVELHTLGTTVEGRTIPYLQVSRSEFGAARDARTLVYVYAQQHGNEVSGKEGALELVLRAARGELDDILEGVDLLLVPQVNPDGGEGHQRQNAEGTDLNRMHLILEAPEVAALRELFHRWEPEVAVDVHEYSPYSGAWLDRGWLRLWDLQIGLPTNLNTDPGIRALAEEAFLPGAIRAMDEAGFTSHNYIVGTPDGLRWSTTNVNDGRQGFAILHTLSFIYEGKREQAPTGNIARRAAAQRTGMEHLLRFASEEGERIRGTVREARARAEAGEARPFVLTMGRDYGDGPLEIPVELAERRNGDWIVRDTVDAMIEAWRPVVTEGRTTTLPDAYLVPAALEGVVELLERHHVVMDRLEAGTSLQVERLELTGFTLEELESTTRIPEVRAVHESYTAAAGDVLVPTAQLRGLLVATALEPESMHGILGYPQFDDLAVEGPYPILRVMER